MTKTETANGHVFADDPLAREWLRDMLKVGPARITFQKTDGTLREMNCTLEPEVVVPYEKKSTRTKTLSTETLAVWDIDKGEWRSFRYDSITTITIVIA